MRWEGWGEVLLQGMGAEALCSHVGVHAARARMGKPTPRARCQVLRGW